MPFNNYLLIKENMKIGIDAKRYFEGPPSGKSVELL